jgi:glutamyl-tRNA synthetase
MREEQKARNLAPRYDNRHRHLTPVQQEAFEQAGRKAVIRFIIDDDREIVWQDLIREKVIWKGSDLGGDMVIARTPENDRENFGQPLYNLAVVVDDIDMEITHVIRGEDHISNTAKQILLYEALGAKLPDFAHTPLILNQEGRKLSKRDGVTSIDDFRKLGFLPQALVNYMMLLGWTPPDSTEEIFTLEASAQVFSLERVNKAGAKFDWTKLDWINSQYLHRLTGEELVPLLLPYWQAAGYNFDIEKEQDWLIGLATLIGPSLTRLSDAVSESRLLLTSLANYNEEAITQLQLEGVKEIIKDILAAITPELTLESAKSIVDKTTKAHQVKKGLVMKSLRAALMGELHGPDLMQSWLLLNHKGWDISRLQQAVNS